MTVYQLRTGGLLCRELAHNPFAFELLIKVLKGEIVATWNIYPKSTYWPIPY